jgi:hypothetical protein
MLAMLSLFFCLAVALFVIEAMLPETPGTRYAAWPMTLVPYPVAILPQQAAKLLGEATVGMTAGVDAARYLWVVDL